MLSLHLPGLIAAVALLILGFMPSCAKKAATGSAAVRTAASPTDISGVDIYALGMQQAEFDGSGFTKRVWGSGTESYRRKYTLVGAASSDGELSVTFRDGVLVSAGVTFFPKDQPALKRIGRLIAANIAGEYGPSLFRIGSPAGLMKEGIGMAQLADKDGDVLQYTASLGLVTLAVSRAQR
jgi:hypothetical protein